MPTNSSHIVELETRFWQSMIDKDTAAAKAMIAEECLVTGAQGAMKLNPGKFAKMMEDGEWTLDEFKFSDIDVVFPSDDTAVIAYKVHQTGTMKDKPTDFTCADASTWVRSDGEWKCSLHTETILADAKAA